MREQLGDFVSSMGEVPELGALLVNPKIDARLKRSALEGLLDGSDVIVRNFLLLLVEKHRVGEVEEIAREFERLAAAEEGRLDVELTTAYELSDEEARTILAQIEKASGRHVDATRKVPGTRRRHRPPGRLAPSRRERARPAYPSSPRFDDKELM